jgi:hypothetical protein
VQDRPEVLASYPKWGGVVRVARKADAQYIAKRLRKADLLELKATTKSNPSVALMASLWVSNPCYSLLVYGEPVALVGLVPQKDTGVIWMMGTDKMLQIKRPFLRGCKEWVNYFLELKPILFNYIHEKNTLHIKWLRWLGFSIINKKDNFGLNGENFYEFVKIKSHV